MDAAVVTEDEVIACILGGKKLKTFKELWDKVKRDFEWLETNNGDT